MTQEVLKLALEALDTSMYPQRKQIDAIAAIQAALAQPAQPPPWWPAVEKILEEYGLQAVEFVADFKAAMKDASQPAQEPVGRFAKFTDGIWREVTDGSPGQPLYTNPPAAQPAPVQEPCGWQFYQDGKWHNGMETSNHRTNTENAGIPVRNVYPPPPAAQRTWVGLTDEEKQEWVDAIPRSPQSRHFMPLINAIESDLKEKNT